MYCNLVKEVGEAFEACELVRVNCTGLNKSDCRKIGAKLKDLVPCILLSFEDEHILMWRGKDWKSSLPQVEDSHTEAEEVITSDPTNPSSSSNDTLLNDQDILISGTGKGLNEELSVEVPTELTLDDKVDKNQTEDLLNLKILGIPVPAHVDPSKKTGEALDFSTETHQESSIISDQGAPAVGAGNSSVDLCLEIPCRSISLDTSLNTIEKGKDLYLSGREAQPLAALYEGCNRHDNIGAATRLDDGMLDSDKLKMREADSLICQDNTSSSRACLEGVMLLLRQAVESGRAIILDDHSLDANIVFERSVALAKTALPGPVFQHRVRKYTVRRTQKDKGDKIEEQDTEVEAVPVSEKRCSERNNSRSRRRDDFPEVLSDVVPHGSLRVDELAKLLA